MVTVAHVVSNIIQKRPFLEEALVNDIINYAYLADMLKPEIEKELRHEVNRYAIIMAIRRFAETLKESFVGNPQLNLDDADITITSGIFEVTVVKDSDTMKTASRLYGLVDFNKGDFLTITQGLYEITILSNTKYKNKMLDLFDKKEIKKVSTGLSSLTVRIPQKTAETVGLLYSLTKALSWENVNIYEVVSTLTEEIFIISEDDTSVAFDAIKRLIKNDHAAKAR
jgi:aspartokinase